MIEDESHDEEERNDDEESQDEKRNDNESSPDPEPIITQMFASINKKLDATDKRNKKLDNLVQAQQEQMKRDKVCDDLLLAELEQAKDVIKKKEL